MASTSTTAPAAGGLSAAARLARYEAAFVGLQAPFAFVDLDAMWANSADMLSRAGGKPIRVASKSLRCRGLQRMILEREQGYAGLLTYTLAETLWLAREGFETLLLAYPTADRDALAALAALSAEARTAPIVMVDCAEQLDLIEAAVGLSRRPRVLDFDASLWLAGA
jgi:D-serine deaminase-like pyridoxal phosphate-dependent protein